MDDVPDEILLGRNINATARHVYSVIYRYPGRSLMELSRMIGLDRYCVKRHCESLKAAGWVDVKKGGKGYSIFAMIPREVQKRLAREISDIIDQAGYRGEALMKAWLNALFADRDYVDNFRPDFIRYPKTDQPLEYDRYYPRVQVAVEFNGLQHFRPTKRFPGQAEYDDQQTRDLVKEALSIKHGITLVTIEAKDLSLKMMLEKVRGLTSARVDADGPYVKMLEKLSKGYTDWAARKAVELAREMDQHGPGDAR